MGRRVQTSNRTKMPTGFRSLRDLLTATLGAGGIIHETLVAEAERPTLLIIFAGLLGLPLVFRESDKGGAPSGDLQRSGGASNDEQR